MTWIQSMLKLLLSACTNFFSNFEFSSNLEKLALYGRQTFFCWRYNLNISRWSRIPSSNPSGRDIWLYPRDNWRFWLISVHPLLVIFIESPEEDEIESIPLPNVSSSILQKVIEFLSHYIENPMDEIPKVWIKIFDFSHFFIDDISITFRVIHSQFPGQKGYQISSPHFMPNLSCC